MRYIKILIIPLIIFSTGAFAQWYQTSSITPSVQEVQDYTDSNNNSTYKGNCSYQVGSQEINSGGISPTLSFYNWRTMYKFVFPSLPSHPNQRPLKL